MPTKPDVSEINQKSNLMLVTLVISGASGAISSLLLGLLLIDIGSTFNVSVGIAGQLNTVTFLVAILFSLLTGLLSVKFDHKRILQIGILAYSVVGLGCFYATDFLTMMFFYSFTGIGIALGNTMIFTLTNLFPTEKRGQVIGFIMAGMSGSYLIGTIIVPQLVGLGGWKFGFVGYLLPISLLSQFLVIIAIPKRTSEEESNYPQVKASVGFRSVLSNKSAIFSLLGYLLAMAMWASLTYMVSYFREFYKISIAESSIILLLASFGYMVGSLTSSKLAKKFGRKPLIGAAITLAGILLILIPFLPIVLVSVGIFGLICLLVSWMDTSST
ncbi:MFS transporter, partial [Candidatus Bathyarchaeota archaeon]|nr:MFS transporter [Candidatus Bathyarchaeota archaeon]